MKKLSGIFVFGSNLAGRHGAGAAKAAYENGLCTYGVGRGPCSGPKGFSYALPTKDKSMKPLSVLMLKFMVDEFIQFASQYADVDFLLTKIGTGLAGFKEEDVAKLFAAAGHNVWLIDEKQAIIYKANHWKDYTEGGED